MAYTSDIHEVAVLMSRLQQNYSQLANNWYTIFFDPVPREEITVTWWDEDGNQITKTLPNRAWDNQYIKHGTGSPEGVVTADVGSVYYDTSVGDGYIKRVGASANTGWDRFASLTEFNSYILKGAYEPEGQVTAGIGTLFVNTALGKLWIKKEGTGDTGWYEPTVTKQYVDDQDALRADLSLSNLNTTGEKHFVNKKQISNCILEAPNGVCTASTSVITAKHGATYLMPGQTVNNAIVSRNADGTLSNTEHTLTVDQNFTPSGVTTGVNYTGFLTYNENIEAFLCVPSVYVYYSTSTSPAPASGAYMMWYSHDKNIWKYSANGGSWENKIAVPMCTFEVDDSNNIINLVAKKPVTIAKGYDLDHLREEAVLLNNNQTITGKKTFSNMTTFQGSVKLTGSGVTSQRVFVSGNNGLVQSSDITTTELNYLDNATSNIQTQINNINNTAVFLNNDQTITGQKTFSNNVKLTGSGVTSQRVFVSGNNGLVQSSGITTTELNYLDNVSSNIQTQINNIKTPDSTFKTTLLNLLYPVNSIYITVNTSESCPIASTLGGTWELVSKDRVLQGASNASGAGGTKAAGLPNITGSHTHGSGAYNTVGTASGAFSIGSEDGAIGQDGGPIKKYGVSFNASQSNSIYGSSSTVQPPAYLVNVWKRTA